MELKLIINLSLVVIGLNIAIRKLELRAERVLSPKNGRIRSCQYWFIGKYRSER
jgi:hypothetical protein